MTEEEYEPLDQSYLDQDVSYADAQKEEQRAQASGGSGQAAAQQQWRQRESDECGQNADANHCE